MPKEPHNCHFCGTYVLDGFETITEKIEVRDHLEEHRNELNVSTRVVDVSDEGSATTEESEQSYGT